MAGESRFLENLGVEYVKDDAGNRVIALDIREQHLQVNGVVHGSVIHALMDTVMGMVVFRALDRNPCATAEISVRYLEPVFDGRLEARARIVKHGKRVIAVESDVMRGDVKVAVAMATFVPINTTG